MHLKKIILFYNTPWENPLNLKINGLPANYRLTTDKGLLSSAAAVVFHLPTIHPFRILAERIKKRKHQLWVAWSMECEAHYPRMSNPLFMKLFDVEMTYHLNADIVVPYLYPEMQFLLKKPANKKKPGNIVNAFISSSFDKSGRTAYLKTLMKSMDVHSYGNLFRNKTIKNDTGHPSKIDTISTYKFTLAFENAIWQDYVTEKFFDPLLAGSVPVYLGAPNIDDFAPGKNCYINVNDWKSPEELAEYLCFVSKNETEYQRYFEWKTQPFTPGFIQLLNAQKKHAFIRLCNVIESLT